MLVLKIKLTSLLALVEAHFFFIKKKKAVKR